MKLQAHTREAPAHELHLLRFVLRAIICDPPDAAELFDELADFDAVRTYLDAGNLVTSVWHPQMIEAGREDTKWTHFQTYRLIAGPA